ncbi:MULTISPECIES: hypothetical protein [Acidobacterium]|uniref:DUF1641 domain-containing protein n=1 Tax=Acidobacterium capsulatum (strain ATCC 51196 / DSM 11244 / BCRC 80197 / JCM 7670 / NBRC 15755 / NCIMB 13165 / 161) TaxID=240015 RepID=C1F9U5_ACIC5|nr:MULTISPECIES: hypothetical protein [Acidobacterium]ACO33626.1 conserved hypothetical protein [Acidobacterium capsulatum ATCC 51196]HCT61688.1 hypothetical protein [Acidobacterium sp.]
MAQPIEFRPSAQDPREEIQRRLNDAPIEHAQALLACYGLIEEAHRSGTLDLLRGLLGAQDAVVTHVSGVVSKPESVNALRNGLLLAKLLGSIDPDTLHNILDETHKSAAQEPPSLFALLGRAASAESRRALAAGLALLQSAGKALGRSR